MRTSRVGVSGSSGLLVGFLVLASVSRTAAQTPPASASAAPAAQAHADLNQLMRGIFFPLSNAVFFAQGEDPATIPRAPQPSASPNPLTGAFGGWEAVENSALGLADAASLLMTPGRKCSNGKPVPVNKPDWATLVQGVRVASMKAYEAAKAKSQDRILEVSEELALSCSNCHRPYRENGAQLGNNSNRCPQ